LKRIAKALLGMILLVSCLSASDKAERKVLEHDDPEYPGIAAKMELHGTVKLRIWIAPDGSVRRVEYTGGHPLLAESAVKTVKKWKYERAETESNQIVELHF
jgi:TonB family protein